LAAAYVVDHFVIDLEVEVINGLLRIHFPTSAGTTYFDFVRINGRPEDAN